MNEAFHTPDVRSLSSEESAELRALIATLTEEIDGVARERLSDEERDTLEKNESYIRALLAEARLLN